MIIEKKTQQNVTKLQKIAEFTNITKPKPVNSFISQSEKYGRQKTENNCDIFFKKKLLTNISVVWFWRPFFWRQTIVNVNIVI